MQQFIEKYRRDIIGVLCRAVRSRAGWALSNDKLVRELLQREGLNEGLARACVS